MSRRDLERYMREAVKVTTTRPVLLDRFLNDAIECDVDWVRYAATNGATWIDGAMEHLDTGKITVATGRAPLTALTVWRATTVTEIKRRPPPWRARWRWSA
jgi:carbamoyl-phosphate synthase large subunit